MSNLNLNKVVLGGRLTADAELKQTPSGTAVCKFSLAINRKYSKEGEQSTDFINCRAWRGTAEFIAKYFRKGSAICVFGSLQTRNWKDKDGNSRSVTEVVVDEAMFVDGKNDAQATETGQMSYIPEAYQPSEKANPDSEAREDAEDDLPF